MELLVFVSPNCAHCPKAEKAVREVAPDYPEISHEKIRMKTREGKDLSSRYHVMATPTILFLDEDNNEVDRIVGAPSENALRKKIEKLLGLRKSFFDNLFNKK